MQVISGAIERINNPSILRFSFDDVPLGPISLRIELADGAVVQTAWTLV